MSHKEGDGGSSGVASRIASTATKKGRLMDEGLILNIGPCSVAQKLGVIALASELRYRGAGGFVIKTQTSQEALPSFVFTVLIFFK